MGKYKTPTPNELKEPILQILSDGKVWKKSEIVAELSNHINLTPTEIESEEFPSGGTVLENYCSLALQSLRDKEDLVIH